MRKAFLIPLTVSLLASGYALAQPAPVPPAKAAPAKTAAAPHKAGRPAASTTGRSAISISCSQQADAKNLHGKDRGKFRRACMKGGK